MHHRRFWHVSVKPWVISGKARLFQYKKKDLFRFCMIKDDIIWPSGGSRGEGAFSYSIRNDACECTSHASPLFHTTYMHNLTLIIRGGSRILEKGGC